VHTGQTDRWGQTTCYEHGAPTSQVTPTHFPRIESSSDMSCFLMQSWFLVC